jgi:hypothetical protein
LSTIIFAGRSIKMSNRDEHNYAVHSVLLESRHRWYEVKIHQ